MNWDNSHLDKKIDPMIKPMHEYKLEYWEKHSSVWLYMWLLSSVVLDRRNSTTKPGAFYPIAVHRLFKSSAVIGLKMQQCHMTPCH